MSPSFHICNHRCSCAPLAEIPCPTPSLGSMQEILLLFWNLSSSLVGFFRASCVAAGFPWVLQRFEVFGPSPCRGAWGLLEVNLGKEEGGWRGRRDTAQGPVFCLTIQSAWFKGSCIPSKLPLILGPWTLPMRLHSHILFTFDCCPVAKNSNTHIKKPCFPQVSPL